MKSCARGVRCDMKLIMSIKRVGLDVIFVGGGGTIGVQVFQSCQMTRWK